LKRLPTILLLILALPGAAPGAPPPRAPRVTYLGESLLSRCDVVVRGVVRSRNILPGGLALVSIRVQETLLGVSPGRRVLLTSPDPSYHGEPGQQVVLFLAREKGKHRLATVERFLVEDERGLERLMMIRAYIECESVPDPRERIAVTRSLHLANITGNEGWTRANAIRELSWFTQHWAGSFDRAERDRLVAVLKALPPSPVRELLATSLRRIDRALPPEERRGTGERSGQRAAARESAYRRILGEVRRSVSGEARAGRLAALALARPARIRQDLGGFLDDEAPEVRRVAAFHAGESECSEAAGALLRVLLRPREDTEVLRQTIRALGILKHEPAQEILTKMALAAAKGEGSASAPLGEAAILALARIGTKEALDVVADLAQISSGDEARDAAILRLIAFVGSESFARQEAILARQRRARLEADRVQDRLAR
jgi:hypothetical protein